MFNINNNSSLLSFVIMIALLFMMTGSLFMAFAMLVLLLIHEMGHFYAAKIKGVPASPPIFTPLGAFIMTAPSANAAEEAFVAFGGPLIGTLASVVAVGLAIAFHSPLLYAAAKWGFFINLFNMIPLSPLDGGRISQAIDRRMWPVGVALLVLAAIQFSSGSPFNLMFFAFIGMQAYQDFQYRQTQSSWYWNVTTKTRATYSAAYLALGGFLLWAVFQPMGLINLFASIGLGG